LSSIFLHYPSLSSIFLHLVLVPCVHEQTSNFRCQ
jgi:hypothetical protein